MHPHIILDCLPSFCQKLSDLVEVRSSYNKNNFARFLRHGIYHIFCEVYFNFDFNIRSACYSLTDIYSIWLCMGRPYKLTLVICLFVY